MSAGKVWIGQGKVVLPGQILENSSVLLENGKIAAIGESCPADAQAVDAQGKWVLPGFIDVHVHGGGNADFMDAEVDAFKVAAHAHALHGTTAMAPTTMTCEDSLLETVIDCFLEADAQGYDNGAQLLGLHLEGPYFSAASKGAQPISEQRIPNREDLERIIARAKGRIIRWDAAPELDNMDIFAQVMKEHGILASAGHTSADAYRAEDAFSWGFSHTTHFYNAMSTFHKKNGIVYSGVIEATYLHDEVTIELIGDGMHIPKQSMLLAHRIKGSDNICLVTDAMRAACTNDTHSMLGAKVGGVPVVIKDTVAQLPDFSSYAGSICTMDRALRTAHVKYGLPLCDVSKMLSLTPARLSGCAHRKGSLEVGKDADIVVMDQDFTVEKVFVMGKQITQEL